MAAMSFPRDVTVVEVGPRDGLQNEPAAIATDDKVAFIDLLSAARLPVIEMASFVSPKWVPRMADAADVARLIRREASVRYTALVPNLAGLGRAKDAGIREVAIFAAASESFSRRNINQGIAESLDTYRHVCEAARAEAIPVRAYLSTAFGCPYEGAVAPDRVRELTARLIELGAFEVSISDTIGVAHPGQVFELLEIVTRAVPASRLALHFHDTRGTALANVLAGLQSGIATFDASAGGLGGCPYAPGATGNLATEDLLYLLHGLGIRTGADLDGVVAASRFIESRLGHSLPSRYYRARQATADRHDHPRT